jgi:hypothetical protein
MAHLPDGYLCTSTLNLVCCAYLATRNPVTLMKMNQSATTASGESMFDLLPSFYISRDNGLHCLAMFSSFSLLEMRVIQILFLSRKSAGIGKFRRRNSMLMLLA